MKNINILLIFYKDVLPERYLLIFDEIQGSGTTCKSKWFKRMILDGNDYQAIETSNCAKPLR